jgi:hypothetical protein
MPKTSAKNESPYGVHPVVAMMQKWILELRAKTGRTLDEWTELVKESGPQTQKERYEWLKTKHKLGSRSAGWIAERAEGKGTADFDDPDKYLQAASEYVQQQYSGPKKELHPMYETLLQLGKSSGAGVKACPCKTIVPLYRNHVFAEIKPTTNSRIDLGLALAKFKGKLPKRVVDTGGLAKKDRITHRIPISSLNDIDAEVKKWLKVAYDLDA